MSRCDSLRAPALALLALAFLSSPAPAASDKHPHSLVVLSTADVEGKVSPCGCHIPKGGLARRAYYADSIRGDYARVLVVDGGSFSDEVNARVNGTALLLDGMKKVGTDVVGIGDHDLAKGLAWLRSELKRVELPAVCANLIDTKSGQPAFPPYVIKKIGDVNVGVFGLVSDKSDLGPARDSLAVKDPIETARAIVPEIRAKGATVVVLLSQLGKVPTDDVTESVEGIDVAVAGRHVPVMQNAKITETTATIYGGEQGHYLGQVVLTLDDKLKVVERSGQAIMLGPDVRDRADLAKMTAPFEKKLQADAAKHGGESKKAEDMYGTSNEAAEKK